MAHIITSKTQAYRDVKPPPGAQINWSHPLACGLIGCWLMNEGQGNIIKDLTQKFSSATLSGAIWTQDSLYFNASDDVITCGVDNLLLNPNCPMTIHARVYPIDGMEGNFGRIIDKNDSTFAFRDSDAATNSSTIYLGIPGSTQLNARGANGQITFNKWQDVSATWTGSVSASDVNLYVNGKIIPHGTDANGSNLTSSVGQILRIGDNYTSTRCYNGNIKYVFAWSRVLSPTEMQQLYIEPYCFISPLRRSFIISAPGTTGGGGGTAHERTYTESLSPSDTYNRLIGRPVFDNLLSTDTFRRAWSASRFLSDTLTPSDSTTKSIALRILVEALTSTDQTVTYLKFFQRLLTESLSLTDSIPGRAISRLLNETILVPDRIFKSMIRSALKESVTLTDQTISFLKFFDKVFTESVTLSDAVKRSIFIALLEALASSDVIPGATPAVPNYDYLETVTLSDEVTTVLRQTWRRVAPTTSTWTQITGSSSSWINITGP